MGPKDQHLLRFFGDSLGRHESNQMYFMSQLYLAKRELRQISVSILRRIHNLAL
jgi:hypothetical protein